MPEFLTALGLAVIMSTQGTAAYMPSSGFTGNVLYCDGRISPPGTLYYSSDLMWAALPLEDFKSGKVQCGDNVVVEFDDETLFLPVLDASRLDIKPSYLGEPFVVELPEHISKRTEHARVTVFRIPR